MTTDAKIPDVKMTEVKKSKTSAEKLAQFERDTIDARVGLGKIKKIIECRPHEVKGLAREQIMEVLDRLLCQVVSSSPDGMAYAGTLSDSPNPQGTI